jgi:outer membrane protein TolC
MAALVDKALTGSPTIEQAAARLDRARAAARATRAALLPDMQVGGGGTAIRQSLEDPVIRPFAGFPAFQRDVERYDATLSASWELDLFGAGPRRKAARATVAAAQADVAATRVMIAAETAAACFNVRELQERLAIARLRVGSLDRQRDALRRRAAAGAVARLDLDRFEGEAEAASAAVPALEALLAAETARLGVLIGDAEAARTLLMTSSAPAAVSSASLEAVQVEIGRRPDVMAAQARLVAADAGLAAARALRFPKLSLGGLLATVASGPSALFTVAATSAQGSGRLSLPLLDFGSIDAAIADARGARREALAGYRQTLLQAAADVEVATLSLARRRLEAERQEKAASALARAEVAAAKTYDAGALDLTLLLDTQRGSLSAREGAVIARAASAKALVSTFRATATAG